MAMKPDLPLASAVWHDFYAVTGFAGGTEVIGYNGGSSRICLFEGDKPPSSTPVQGWPIPMGEAFRVKADAGQAWIRGNGNSVLLCGLQEKTS